MGVQAAACAVPLDDGTASGATATAASTSAGAARVRAVRLQSVNLTRLLQGCDYAYVSRQPDRFSARSRDSDMTKRPRSGEPSAVRFCLFPWGVPGTVKARARF